MAAFMLIAMVVLFALGVNLFAACQVAGIPLQQVIPRLIPFVIVCLACLMIVTYVPAVSVGLLTLLN